MSVKILILTDGKMGDLVQCRGVAGELTDEENIQEYVVQPGWLGSLPLKNMPLPKTETDAVFGSAALCDMVIASGRRTVPYIHVIRQKKEQRPFLIFLKDPRYNYDDIDFTWAPTHDGLAGPNVFSTDTSPHTISTENLTVAAKSGNERFLAFDKPIAGVILGGNSKSVEWNDAAIGQFCKQLAAIPTDTSVLITASRRTPDPLRRATLAALKDHRHWIWDGRGSNPYMEILACSDRLIITGDSHNMVSEALAVGKPVHIFRPPGLHTKLTGFLNKLEDEGFVQDMSLGYDRTEAKKLDSTTEIAAEILKRYAASKYG